MENPFVFVFAGLQSVTEFPRRVISDSLDWWTGKGFPLEQQAREANQAADIFRAGGSAADAAASVAEMQRAGASTPSWQGPLLLVALIAGGAYVVGQAVRKVL